MAGFLDAKERVIDMVLTDIGKTLLLKGDLNFVYWIPFDDEVDYDPPSVSLALGQTQEQRRQELTESPLIREATMGYRGLNLVEEDLTNVHRPMFSAPPGVGHTSPIPQMIVDQTGTAEVRVKQKSIEKVYEQRDTEGNLLSDIVIRDVGVQRYDSSEFLINANYVTQSYPRDFPQEGFLVTLYQSSTFGQHEIFNGSYVLSGSGGFQEIVNTRNSDGQIAYRNDLALRIITK